MTHSLDDASIPAISIRQPWAELILQGSKRIEVRNWVDPYRGALWIHAGRNANHAAAAHFQLDGAFTGGYVGRVTLTDIVPLSEERWERWRSLHRVPGPWQPGSYAWMLENPRRLTSPVPGPGRLRLFRVDADIEARLVSSLDEEIANARD
jgi:hypothetical protein